MKALLVIPAAVICLSLGFLAASCGANEATPAGPVPSAPEPDTGSTTQTLPPEDTVTEVGTVTEGQATYQVWYAQGESLFVTYRTGANIPRIGSAAVEAVLTGPSEFEQDYGLTTSVPQGTELLGLTIDDAIATVDLTSEFEEGGGTLSMQMRLAQVVYTLTQFPTVKGVVFSLDGEPIEVLGGEGLVLDHPLTRKDFRDLLPVILVTSPALNQTVGSPVVVAGSANVFEANVTVRILDENGDEIAHTFTTATCGTGCRGTYRVAVPYNVDEEQSGTIVVHDDDAAGTGRPPHEVRIPVLLTPGA
ncbi:MAG: Gmad2 immunoglobulin-like domain-containing protein [Gaiellaceae bacterium]